MSQRRAPNYQEHAVIDLNRYSTLRVIENWLLSTADNRPVMLLIAGPPGVGKMAFLDRMQNQQVPHIFGWPKVSEELTGKTLNLPLDEGCLREVNGYILGDLIKRRQHFVMLSGLASRSQFDLDVAIIQRAKNEYDYRIAVCALAIDDDTTLWKRYLKPDRYGSQVSNFSDMQQVNQYYRRHLKSVIGLVDHCILINNSTLFDSPKSHAPMAISRRGIIKTARDAPLWVHSYLPDSYLVQDPLGSSSSQSSAAVGDLSTRPLAS